MRGFLMILSAAAVLAGSSLAASAAGPCAADVGAVNNPAFGAPQAKCPPAKAKVAAERKETGPFSGKPAAEVVKSDDGKTTYRYDDGSTVTVGGYVQYQVGISRGTNIKP